MLLYKVTNNWVEIILDFFNEAAGLKDCQYGCTYKENPKSPGEMGNLFVSATMMNYDVNGVLSTYTTYGGNQVAYCNPGDSLIYDTDANGQVFYMCRTAQTSTGSYPTSTFAQPSSLLYAKAGCPNSCDPVRLGTQELNDYQIDYQNQSPFPIVWARRWVGSQNVWKYNYDRKANVTLIDATHATAMVFREDGEIVCLSGVRADNTTDWTWTVDDLNSSYPKYPIIASFKSSQDLSYFYIINKKDETETYHNGLLVKIEDLNHNSLNFTYNSQNQMIRIDDSAGRHLDISYESNLQTNTYNTTLVDANGNPIYNSYSYYNSVGDNFNQSYPKMIDDGGQSIIGYLYQGSSNVTIQSQLINVVYPNSNVLTYQYDSSGNWIKTLDENNDVYQTYTYNPYSSKQVTSTSLGNGQDTYLIS